MGIVQTDEKQSCIQDGTGKADTYKADAEEDGTGRGSEGRGRLEQALRSGIYADFREGQPTLVNIVGVNA